MFRCLIAKLLLCGCQSFIKESYLLTYLLSHVDLMPSLSDSLVLVSHPSNLVDPPSAFTCIGPEAPDNNIPFRYYPALILHLNRS